MANVSGFKLNYEGIGKLLRSDEVRAELMRHGKRIEQSLNAEGHGEFRAFEGDNRTRARVFVDAYDAHAKNAVNAYPSMMARHLGA